MSQLSQPGEQELSFPLPLCSNQVINGLNDSHARCCLGPKLCLTLCDPMDYSLPGSSVHGDSPGKNTGVSCHALLQGIFPTRGLNPGLAHCRQILYCLSYQGSPRILE